MKRIPAYLLPLIFILSSCGAASQYAQQRFADGIYERVEQVSEPVRLYSAEDFEQMAAQNIAMKGIARDTVYVPVYEYTGLSLSSSWFYNDWWYRDPWFYWGDYGWRYGWTYRDPWYYGWGYAPWRGYWWGYDPWYYDPWYRDPWRYDPWRYDPWYGPSYGHHHWRPEPGLSPGGDRYYGQRRGTQPVGSRSGRAGRDNYRPGISGGNYGSAGASQYNGFRLSPGNGSSRPSAVRPNSSSGSDKSNVTPGRNGYNYSRGYQSRNSGSGSVNGGSSSSGGRNSTRSYEYNNSSSGTSSWGSGSRSSGSSYSGGSSSRSYGGGGGSSSHSGGGGNSRGGGRR